MPRDALAVVYPARVEAGVRQIDTGLRVEGENAGRLQGSGKHKSAGAAHAGTICPDLPPGRDMAPDRFDGLIHVLTLPPVVPLRHDMERRNPGFREVIAAKPFLPAYRMALRAW